MQTISDLNRFHYELLRYQTCSMPWGVLSLNGNSDKTWWSKVSLSFAPDCPWYNVLYDRGFVWWHDLNPMKIGKIPPRILDPGFRSICRVLGIFLDFWFVKWQNWIGCERVIKTSCVTTEINDIASLFWPGPGIKEKGDWDPGTCLSVTNIMPCFICVLALRKMVYELEMQSLGPSWLYTEHERWMPGSGTWPQCIA